MSWRVIGGREVGTSHLVSGTPCQDDCWFEVDQLPSGDPLLSMFVSDGAGSASHGGIGSQIAIEAAIETVRKAVAGGLLSLSDSLPGQITDAGRQRIAVRAQEEGLSVRDFACTLLGIISSPELGTLALQIGDGAVVVDLGSGLETAINPMNGEYANTTFFITDANALETLTSKIYPQFVRSAATFSDGLQNLALNLRDNSPHEPFFRPFFETLRTAQSDDEDSLLEQLSQALNRFLDSEIVNSRTDDDKSLVLATWLPDQPNSPTVMTDDQTSPLQNSDG